MFVAPHHRGVSAGEVPIIRTGLVGRWIFDEGSGTTATDDSGYDNHGSLQNIDPGLDWVPGRSGSDTAIRFRFSVQSRMLVPHDARHAPANFSLTCWMRHHDAPVDWAGPASKNISNWSNGWIVFWKDDELRFMYVSDFSNAAVASLASADRNWHHLCCTFDGLTKRIYLDNIEGTPNDKAGTITSQEPLYAGFVEGAGTYYQNIEEQDLRIYDRVLTSQERTDIFNEQG